MNIEQGGTDMGRDMTLLSATLGEASLLRKALLVIGGTVLIALAAQVSVPMIPVPMTLQTLAILMVGFAFGSRLGAVTLLAYLAEGAAGLPVFANGHGTLAYMVGPTGGFLVGFVLLAWLAGLAADRGIARGFLRTAAVALAASVLLYVPGLAWPALILGTEAGALWSGWMAPFLVGDAVKAILAALVITGGWAALARR